MQGRICGQEAALLVPEDSRPLFLEESKKPEEVFTSRRFSCAVFGRSPAGEVIERNQTVYGVPNKTEVGAAGSRSCQTLIQWKMATCYGAFACVILAASQEGGPLCVAIPELTRPRCMNSEELYEGTPCCLRYMDEEEGMGVR